MRPSARKARGRCAVIELARKRPAGLDLFRRRLVLWRHAAHRVGDQHALQFEPVVGPLLVVPGGKAELFERGVKQVAGIVARERPAGAVGALQPGRRPTIISPGSASPQLGTGALKKSG